MKSCSLPEHKIVQQLSWTVHRYDDLGTCSGLRSTQEVRSLFLVSVFSLPDISLTEPGDFPSGLAQLSLLDAMPL